MNTVLIVATLAEVLLLVLVLAGYLLAITGTLTKIADTAQFGPELEFFVFDQQVRPIDMQVRGINGALGKVAAALTRATS